MLYSPLTYEQPVFRPPSEAASLILQVTRGCSWNKCAFCEMYTSKKFSVKDQDLISREIMEAALWYPGVRKVFLADGNAMVLSTARLMKILEMINAAFKRVVRISVYSGARDLENKSVDELKELKEAGLKLIYMGIESGNDHLLTLVNKGETSISMERNLLKAKDAGIKSSVMILTGLGGKEFSRAHAIDSAALVSRIQPDYLSTLVLSFPFGPEHFKARFTGNYLEMDRVDLLHELSLFIEQVDLHDVVFRSDHASNYLALKGILNRDKDRMLAEISQALSDPAGSHLREEWQRGL